MSIVPKETIEVIAQSIGISNLSADAALALAPDVEYRMREIMQEAVKCMRHSRRTVLTADDVDSALKLKNVEPIYGFASGGPLRFRKAIGHKDLFYLEDKDIDIKDVIDAPLPKAPLDTAVLCHWLAIEGVQPAIPENAPVQVISAPSDGKIQQQKDDKLPVDIKLPVRHVLSRELQLYFEKITELAVRNSESILFKEALVSLATDSGLHPLVPYFTCFIADEVSRGLNDLPLLLALMRVVRSLLLNAHINIEPYLHQLMPAVVTCIVAKRLGKRLSDNHWELREFAANLVASICRRFGQVYTTLQTRLTKQLVNAFLNPSHSLPTHYGAIQGLSALGSNLVRLLILPNLEQYVRLLEPEMLLEQQKNKMKRYEAWHVYGALLRACGQFVHNRFKILPPLHSSGRTLMRTGARVITSGANKRKMTSENSDHLRSSKRTAIDGPITAVAPSSLQEVTTNSTLRVDSSAVPSPSSGPTPSNNGAVVGVESEAEDRDGGASTTASNSSCLNPRLSTTIEHIWKDDFDSGNLLVTLSELFGSHWKKRIMKSVLETHDECIS
ncbi:hypothetical protein SAY87_001429 [Trapa incisa]|uniref:TATA box binding protein associated factor (TAF) histone-like fold domain-containing protein n=1 Tax=Trapa incisa TaxID=236973 RepID=A0AAN7GG45_9MYRT|nr:hypothetical protein SAY87_001429 [Trapa incisa]